MGAPLKEVAKQKELHKLKIQELLLKGYPPQKILEVLNLERKDQGKPPYIRQTIYKFLDEIRQEHSRWYLDMMRDQTAYIVLHRQKLLALQLYKKMLHDKIAIGGGLSAIKADALNRIIQTLHSLTISESKLEKELPYLYGINKTKTGEELRQIEGSIIAGLPDHVREQYEKDIHERNTEEISNVFDLNSDSFPNPEDMSIDQYVISLEQISVPTDLEKIQKEVEDKTLGAHQTASALDKKKSISPE